MTNWEEIYKDYQKGGEAWATLSEGIHPLFKKFLEESKFKQKSAFDIGCGTGKYLKFLQGLGFKTEGVDQSKTAVKMTKELLNDNSKIECANMYNYKIEPQKI